MWSQLSAAEECRSAKTVLLLLCQKFLRLPAQQLQGQTPVPGVCGRGLGRLGRWLVDLLYGFLEPVCRFRGVAQPMLGHGLEKPVVNHRAPRGRSRLESTCRLGQTLGRLLEPAGTVEHGAEVVDRVVVLPAIGVCFLR